MTPEREAAVRARVAEWRATSPGRRALVEQLGAYDARGDLAETLAELDRVREERDGLRARILGFAAKLDEPCLRVEGRPSPDATRLRELL